MTASQPAPAPPAKGMTAISILVRACREFGVSRDDIRGTDRRRSFVCIRREIARRCRAAGYSLPEIARALGRRDHTSVLWLLRGGRTKAWTAAQQARRAVAP